MTRSIGTYDEGGCYMNSTMKKPNCNFTSTSRNGVRYSHEAVQDVAVSWYIGLADGKRPKTGFSSHLRVETNTYQAGEAQ